MSEDKKEMSKYIGELIKIKFAELSHTIKIIKEKMIKPNSDSIEELEKKVEKNKLDGQIRGTGMNGFEVFLKDCKKEISELKEKVNAWIDDIRIGNKQRTELKGFTYNQSNDKWQTIKNIENVLLELKSIIKSTEFDMNAWTKTILNKKLDDIFKKLEGEKPSKPLIVKMDEDTVFDLREPIEKPSMELCKTLNVVEQ